LRLSERNPQSFPQKSIFFTESSTCQILCFLHWEGTLSHHSAQIEKALRQQGLSLLLQPRVNYLVVAGLVAGAVVFGAAVAGTLGVVVWLVAAGAGTPDFTL
jgi:hypothetical protein